MNFCGISVLAAEMPNKSSCALIEIYPGELCHQDIIWHHKQLIRRLNLTCVIKCLLKHGGT